MKIPLSRCGSSALPGEVVGWEFLSPPHLQLVMDRAHPGSILQGRLEMQLGFPSGCPQGMALIPSRNGWAGWISLQQQGPAVCRSLGAAAG